MLCCVYVEQPDSRGAEEVEDRDVGGTIDGPLVVGVSDEQVTAVEADDGPAGVLLDEAGPEKKDEEEVDPS